MSNIASRRELLAGLGGGAAASALALSVPEAAAAAAPSVRGTWTITPRSSRGPSPFRALAAFAAGGVFTTTGSDEAGTGLGVWVSRGATGFAFTYANFHFGSDGKLANTVKVAATGSFSGSSMTGRATLSTFGPDGRRLSPDARFAFTGRRMGL